jgi:hypothetical protein
VRDIHPVNPPQPDPLRSGIQKSPAIVPGFSLPIGSISHFKAIPRVMTLRTLDDVRDLMRHLPESHRDRPPWQHVAGSWTKQPPVPMWSTSTWRCA